MSNGTSAGALASINELRIDAKIGKGKHFVASQRKLFYHRLLGIPVIIINLLVAIVIFQLQSPNFGKSHQQIPTEKPASVSEATLPESSGPADLSRKNFEKESASKNSSSGFRTIFEEWVPLVSVFLVFFAACLSGIQTFFNFQKLFEQHRAIGNRYTSLSRKCKALLLRQQDLPYPTAELWSKYEDLFLKYEKINTDGAMLPTSPGDLKKSKATDKISKFVNPHIKDEAP